VSPRPGPRTASCSRQDATVRFDQARKFLEVAELVKTEADLLPSAGSVAAALAVLAGIAATDSACCAALGRRSRSQDHRYAADLVRQIEPGGPADATRLVRLLDVKDTAHYGVIYISGTDLAAAIRSAKHLIDFAAVIVQRR
jgi:hypothetical protein